MSGLTIIECSTSAEQIDDFIGNLMMTGNVEGDDDFLTLLDKYGGEGKNYQYDENFGSAPLNFSEEERRHIQAYLGRSGGSGKERQLQDVMIRVPKDMVKNVFGDTFWVRDLYLVTYQEFTNGEPSVDAEGNFVTGICFVGEDENRGALSAVQGFSEQCEDRIRKDNFASFVHDVTKNFENDVQTAMLEAFQTERDPGTGVTTVSMDVTSTEITDDEGNVIGVRGQIIPTYAEDVEQEQAPSLGMPQQAPNFGINEPSALPKPNSAPIVQEEDDSLFDF